MIVKNIWTDDDFNSMGWHDVRLYLLRFPNENLEMSFTIDYIFKWEKTNENNFQIWSSPCELIFGEVLNLELNLSFSDTACIDILSIVREYKELSSGGITIWNYRIETDRGVISFDSVGFKQIVKSSPVLRE